MLCSALLADGTTHTSLNRAGTRGLRGCEGDEDCFAFQRESPAACGQIRNPKPENLYPKRNSKQAFAAEFGVRPRLLSG